MTEYRLCDSILIFLCLNQWSCIKRDVVSRYIAYVLFLHLTKYTSGCLGLINGCYGRLVSHHLLISARSFWWMTERPLIPISSVSPLENIFDFHPILIQYTSMLLLLCCCFHLYLWCRIQLPNDDDDDRIILNEEGGEYKKLLLLSLQYQ